MKIRSGLQRWLAVVVLVGILLTAIAACGGASSGDVAADGEALLQDRCTQCHSLERVTTASKTRDEWQTTVDRMIAQGAELNNAETEVLVGYLAETYGP